MPVCENKSDIYTLVQITDSHLYADPAQTLLGLPTDESLKAVVELVRREQTAIDLVLATGDISQDGSAASYQRFAQQIAPLGAPMRWLAGNHDVTAVQQAAAQGAEWSQPVVALPFWRISLLDSSVDGEVYGSLQQEQLELLDSSLAAAGERNVLVCLHHHPVSVQSRWLDSIGLRNAEALFAVLERYSTVRCLLWGHIHQEVDIWREQVRLLATPSTCIQFAPQSDDFALDTRLPGYRWLRLHPDGHIESAVSRLERLDYTIDFSQSGY